ncbi:LemA family protein [Paraburkholderia phenoliruptrix]|uniref:LemA family protein n=1 Tax=Paraburkholderia phenoliruptrix TaxID=252970 RepID=UPI003D96CCE5
MRPRREAGSGGVTRLHGYLLGVIVWTVTLLFVASLPGGCSAYSAPPDNAEVDAALRNVLDQYEARGKLVRELIALAQPLAGDNGTLVGAVTVAQADLDCVRLDPQALAEQVPFERFEVAERQLGDAISRLLIELGNDRRIGQDARFDALRKQLGAVERRAAITRDAYDQTVDRYNASLDALPDATTHRPALRPRPTFRVVAETANRQM